MATGESTAATSNGNGSATTRKVLLVDMGKQRRKRIKRLRKGYGKLMDRVHETLNQLEADGEIGDASDVVVVVVKEKRKRRGMWF